MRLKNFEKELEQTYKALPRKRIGKLDYTGDNLLYAEPISETYSNAQSLRELLTTSIANIDSYEFKNVEIYRDFVIFNYKSIVDGVECMGLLHITPEYVHTRVEIPRYELERISDTGKTSINKLFSNTVIGDIKDTRLVVTNESLVVTHISSKYVDEDDATIRQPLHLDTESFTDYSSLVSLCIRKADQYMLDEKHKLEPNKPARVVVYPKLNTSDIYYNKPYTQKQLTPTDIGIDRPVGINLVAKSKRENTINITPNVITMLKVTPSVRLTNNITVHLNPKGNVPNSDTIPFHDGYYYTTYKGNEVYIALDKERYLALNNHFTRQATKFLLLGTLNKNSLKLKLDCDTPHNNICLVSSLKEDIRGNAAALSEYPYTIRELNLQ